MIFHQSIPLLIDYQYQMLSFSISRYLYLQTTSTRCYHSPLVDTSTYRLLIPDVIILHQSIPLLIDYQYQMLSFSISRYLYLWTTSTPMLSFSISRYLYLYTTNTRCYHSPLVDTSTYELLVPDVIILHQSIPLRIDYQYPMLSFSISRYLYLRTTSTRCYHSPLVDTSTYRLLVPDVIIPHQSISSPLVIPDVIIPHQSISLLMDYQYPMLSFSIGRYLYIWTTSTRCYHSPLVDISIYGLLIPDVIIPHQSISLLMDYQYPMLSFSIGRYLYLWTTSTRCYHSPLVDTSTYGLLVPDVIILHQSIPLLMDYQYPMLSFSISRYLYLQTTSTRCYHSPLVDTSTYGLLVPDVMILHQSIPLLIDYQYPMLSFSIGRYLYLWTTSTRCYHSPLVDTSTYGLLVPDVIILHQSIPLLMDYQYLMLSFSISRYLYLQTTST